MYSVFVVRNMSVILLRVYYKLSNSTYIQEDYSYRLIHGEASRKDFFSPIIIAKLPPEQDSATGGNIVEILYI